MNANSDDHDFCRLCLAESRREQRKRRVAIGRLTTHRYKRVRMFYYRVYEHVNDGHRVLGDYEACCAWYAKSLAITGLLNGTDARLDASKARRGT